MRLVVTFKGGRQKTYNGVRYASAYPHEPAIMRVEFLDDLYPAMTLLLIGIENFTLLDDATIERLSPKEDTENNS